MEPLPPRVESKRAALAQALGRPVVVRGLRSPDPGWRGRLRVSRRLALIEYQVAQHGFFWHIPIIEDLLARAAEGCQEVELRDPDGGAGGGPRER